MIKVDQYRCTYCRAVIPWPITPDDLGLQPGEQPQAGHLYPYEKCYCGWGKFVVYERSGPHEAAGDGVSSPPDGATVATATRAKVENARYERLPVAMVRPNPRQPRKFFDAEALRGLAESIKKIGLLEDILVRPREDGTYEIVLGERRWRASQLAGIESIPAKVVDLTDEEARLIALTENIHREDLTKVEEAFSFKSFVDEGKQLTTVGDYLGGMEKRVAERLKTLNSHYYVRFQEERIEQLQRMVETLRERLKMHELGRFEAKLVSQEELAAHLAEGFDVAAVLPNGQIAVRRRMI